MMLPMRNLIIVVFVTALLSGCDKSPESSAEAISEPSDAAMIATNSIIVDTHIDVPIRRYTRPADVSESIVDGNFDYPRAMAGALNAPFMSIYTMASLEIEGKSKALAEKLIDYVESLVEQSPDKFALANSPREVREQFSKGLISLPMGMENGSPLEDELDNVDYFFERGIRYITLAHSKSNLISDSSSDTDQPWNGLSPFGVSVVERMNHLGMMIDVSHISDQAFYHVIEVSKVAVIASHSSARHFTPGYDRNMSDEMIIKLAKNGGVININFGSSFLTAEAQEYVKSRSAAMKVWMQTNEDVSATDAYLIYPSIYAKENDAFPYASLDEVLDHFDHVVSLTSIDHVGVGSDYDGIGDTLPIGLKDVSAYPNLVQGLLDRGYSEEDIRKVLGENILRVWQEAIDYAATTSNNT